MNNNVTFGLNEQKTISDIITAESARAQNMLAKQMQAREYIEKIRQYAREADRQDKQFEFNKSNAAALANFNNKKFGFEQQRHADEMALRRAELEQKQGAAAQQMRDKEQQANTEYLTQALLGKQDATKHEQDAAFERQKKREEMLERIEALEKVSEEAYKDSNVATRTLADVLGMPSLAGKKYKTLQDSQTAITDTLLDGMPKTEAVWQGMRDILAQSPIETQKDYIKRLKTVFIQESAEKTGGKLYYNGKSFKPNEDFIKSALTNGVEWQNAPDSLKQETLLLLNANPHYLETIKDKIAKEAEEQKKKDVNSVMQLSNTNNAAEQLNNTNNATFSLNGTANLPPLDIGSFNEQEQKDIEYAAKALVVKGVVKDIDEARAKAAEYVNDKNEAKIETEARKLAEQFDTSVEEEVDNIKSGRHKNWMMYANAAKNHYRGDLEAAYKGVREQMSAGGKAKGFADSLVDTGRNLANFFGAGIEKGESNNAQHYSPQDTDTGHAMGDIGTALVAGIPLGAGLGAVGGAAATKLPWVKRAVDALNSSKIGKAALFAGEGAANAGVYEALVSEDGKRVDNALTGALIGGGLGAAFPGLAAAFNKMKNVKTDGAFAEIPKMLKEVDEFWVKNPKAAELLQKNGGETVLINDLMSNSATFRNLPQSDKETIVKEFKKHLQLDNGNSQAVKQLQLGNDTTQDTGRQLQNLLSEGAENIADAPVYQASQAIKDAYERQYDVANKAYKDYFAKNANITVGNAKTFATNIDHYFDNGTAIKEFKNILQDAFNENPALFGQNETYKSVANKFLTKKEPFNLAQLNELKQSAYALNKQYNTAEYKNIHRDISKYLDEGATIPQGVRDELNALDKAYGETIGVFKDNKKTGAFVIGDVEQYAGIKNFGKNNADIKVFEAMSKAEQQNVAAAILDAKNPVNKWHEVDVKNYISTYNQLSPNQKRMLDILNPNIKETLEVAKSLQDGIRRHGVALLEKHNIKTGIQAVPLLKEMAGNHIVAVISSLFGGLKAGGVVYLMKQYLKWSAAGKSMVKDRAIREAYKQITAATGLGEDAINGLLQEVVSNPALTDLALKSMIFGGADEENGASAQSTE